MLRKATRADRSGECSGEDGRALMGEPRPAAGDRAHPRRISLVKEEEEEAWRCREGDEPSGDAGGLLEHPLLSLLPLLRRCCCLVPVISSAEGA